MAAASLSQRPVTQERRAQIYPTLAQGDIDRLRRFGELASYAAGERVGLLESSNSGPVIIGPPDHPDVLRLRGFLARSAQPHRVLDCETDSCAMTLVERFRIDPHHLPIVLCPNGKLLRNPGDSDLAR